MKFNFKTIVLAATAVMIMLNFNGCSYIIPMTGKFLVKEFMVVTVMDLQNIDKGTEIIVVHYNGRKFYGKYLGRTFLSEIEYRSKYDNFRKNKVERIILPELGDTVVVALYPEKNYTGELLGFDYGYTGMICLRIESSGDSVKLDLERVRYLDAGDSHRIKGTSLRELASNSRIPCLTGFTIQADSLEISFGVEEVRWIEVSTAEKKSIELLVSLISVVGLGSVIWLFSNVFR